MKLETSAAFPNSVVLVMDFKSGEPPESMGEGPIATSESCVAIGTLAEHSGETHLELTDNLEEVDPAQMRTSFDGHIRTTSGEVSLVSARNERLITLPVASDC